MSTKELEDLKSNPRYLVFDCRGNLQAVDLDKVYNSEKDVFIEIYYKGGLKLRGTNYLKDLDTKSVFMSPFSIEDVFHLGMGGIDFKSHLKNVISERQINRHRFFQKDFTSKAFSEFKERSEDAYFELQSLENYDEILINKDSPEGSLNWHLLSTGKFKTNMDESIYPEGDARRVLERMVEILKR